MQGPALIPNFFLLFIKDLQKSAHISIHTMPMNPARINHSILIIAPHRPLLISLEEARMQQTYTLVSDLNGTLIILCNNPLKKSFSSGLTILFVFPSITLFPAEQGGNNFSTVSFAFSQ